MDSAAGKNLENPYHALRVGYIYGGLCLGSKIDSCCLPVGATWNLFSRADMDMERAACSMVSAGFALVSLWSHGASFPDLNCPVTEP